jgi:two-component system, NarL family, nitrate/nitrite response regulator NarL
MTNCWTYSSPDECLARLAEDQPDVVLLDLALRGREGLDGVTVLAEIGLRAPKVRVIVLSGTSISSAVLKCRRSGAKAFLRKGEVDANALSQVIRRVMNGESVFPDDTAPSHQTMLIHSGLSARELEVLGYIAAGADNLQIAAYLGITERTVKAHVSSLYGKMNVENRVQLALAAQQAGIPSPSAFQS